MGGTTVIDAFWKNVDECMDAVEQASTVDEVITILKRHFQPSAGEAFFGGSGGDRQMYEALMTAGWTILWSEADYWFVAQDKQGNLLTYTEGDVSRGDGRPAGH